MKENEVSFEIHTTTNTFIICIIELAVLYSIVYLTFVWLQFVCLTLCIFNYVHLCTREDFSLFFFYCTFVPYVKYKKKNKIFAGWQKRNADCLPYTQPQIIVLISVEEVTPNFERQSRTFRLPRMLKSEYFTVLKQVFWLDAIN